MEVNHKKEYEDIQMSKQDITHEPTVAYQRRTSESGITRMTNQKELETECFSLEESRNKLVDKIHRHFHYHL